MNLGLRVHIQYLYTMYFVVGRVSACFFRKAFLFYHNYQLQKNVLDFCMNMNDIFLFLFDYIYCIPLAPSMNKFFIILCVKNLENILVSLTFSKQFDGKKNSFNIHVHGVPKMLDSYIIKIKVIITSIIFEY